MQQDLGQPVCGLQVIGPSACAASETAQAARLAPVQRPRRLVLFGLPPGIAEPVAMIADILDWQVVILPPGPAMLPPADLCLAMLPAETGAPLPPIAVWSPETNLNELIFQLKLSILEQPPCIQHLEQLLQISAEIP